MLNDQQHQFLRDAQDAYRAAIRDAFDNAVRRSFDTMQDVANRQREFAQAQARADEALRLAYGKIPN